MKKITVLVAALFLFLGTSFGQAKDTGPQHSPFASYGMSWTPSSSLTYSGEVGTWGTKSPTSFSLTFDATRSTLSGPATFNKWMGAKAYYTLPGGGPKLCYMVYIKGAVQLDSTQNTLLEFGFNPNYTLSKHFLLGVTVGNQTLQGSQWNLFTSAGIVYLFKP